MTNTQIIENFMKKYKIDKKKDVTKGKTESGETIGDILAKETERLMSYIQEGIDAYYASYTPVRYPSTGDLKNSLYIYIDKSNPNSLIISFKNDHAWKMSYVTGEENSGYTPILMDVGWDWNNPKYDIPRFSRFEGAHYISSAIDKFNSSNTYNLKIKIDKNSLDFDVPEYANYL